MIEYRVVVRAMSLIGTGLFLFGCSGADFTAPEEGAAESVQSPIIHGSPDTHDGVVGTYTGSSLCTGTIVSTKGNTGYVLTAAHCCESDSPPKQVRIGADFRAAKVYTVKKYLAHASYTGSAGSSYDFCMVSFDDGDGNMKVIPALPPELDNVKVGDTLDAVGYGRTESEPHGSSNLALKRLHVTYDVKAFRSSGLKADFDAREGGTCEGDSGGPDLVTIDGKTYVHGVHSTVDTYDCNNTSTSGVVSKVNPWIQDFISRN
ncbi:trypsin-like serine protease [Pendulispora rubella]|uniref:Trypsin-like serine protease n=1 Tax=Pendulispora rubella TaxID=2741070 RepID=A0ABZ2KU65_9BACT